MKKHEFRLRQAYDPVLVLAALREECSHPRQGEDVDRVQESKDQVEALVSWFRKNTALKTREKTTTDDRLSGDHCIHFDKSDTPKFMETLKGRFGKIVDPEFVTPPLRTSKAAKTVPLIDATPEEYLERMVSVNLQFKTGWGVIGIAKKSGDFVIKTTVPTITTNELLKNEIGPWLEALGWLPVENYKGTFYSSAKELLIVQTPENSTLLSTNTIHPATGFLISRPCANLKRYLGLVSEDLIVPSPCPFENGPVDLQLLDTFQRLVESKNRPVASADLPDPALGVESLIDHWIDHSRQVDEALRKKASELVSRMNRNTTKEVAVRLKIPLPENWDMLNPASLDDPVTGPLLLALRDDSMGMKTRKQRYLETLLNHEYEAMESGREVKIPRRGLPCPTIEALKYLAENPDVSSSDLETAFQAFLAVVLSVEEAEREEKETIRLKAKISDLAGKISSRLSLGIQPNPKLEENRASYEAELKKLSEIQQSRNCFVPGAVLHPDLKWKAEMSWVRFSREAKPVDTVTMIELITGGFQKFWQKYYARFQRLSSDAEIKSQKLSRTRSETGRKGAPVREHIKWVKLTNDFIAHLKQHKREDVQIDMLQHLDGFLMSSKEGPRTKTKQKEFLGTLITYSSKVPPEKDFSGVLEILRKSAIKAIKVETIEDCLKALKDATKKKTPTSKKTQKNI